MLTRPDYHFDCGPDGVACRFARPVACIEAHHPDALDTCWASLEAARREGLWLAGVASYELGHCLEPTLRRCLPADRREPLLLFHAFEGPGPTDTDTVLDGHLSPLTPDWTPTRYRAAFGRVASYLRSGDSYQVNLTFRCRGDWRGDPMAIHRYLQARQPSVHGALVRDGEGGAIVSRSPELFFRLDRDRQLTTRPMKGTLARVEDPDADRQARRALADDPKNQAENLMIVDLLRNDLGRIATIGSVRVPELFAVQSLPTVHQMTSTITAELRPEIDLKALFTALFPCGSITGAPKIRAMQIICELEDSPRGVYCGAIGWIAPDGRMDFNVAIRTLRLHADGSAELGVGGGVVLDSTAEGEFAEALLKSRFAGECERIPPFPFVANQSP